MGYRQQEKLKDIYSIEGYCFVPIFDLCNKKISNSGKLSYEVSYTNKFIKIALPKSFKKGEEIYFTENYKVDLSNKELIILTEALSEITLTLFLFST